MTRRKSNSLRAADVLLAGVLCCGVMALVDGVLQPGYLLKSAVKLSLFLGIPAVLWAADRDIAVWKFLRPGRKGLVSSLVLGIGLYALILGVYVGFGRFFDLSGIVGSLSENVGVKKENFLLVSLYISFVNSLLEEFFFRGFLCGNLLRYSSKATAFGVSSAVFSLYHVAMMLGWFDLPIFFLALTGLFAGGLIFCWLNDKHGSIYTSWFVHMFANFAINTIGFMLMG